MARAKLKARGAASRAPRSWRESRQSTLRDSCWPAGRGWPDRRAEGGAEEDLSDAKVARAPAPYFADRDRVRLLTKTKSWYKTFFEVDTKTWYFLRFLPIERKGARLVVYIVVIQLIGNWN